MGESASIGDNSASPLAQEQLRSFVRRIEALEEESKGLRSDIRDVYHEAKSAGFDAKVIRHVIRLRRLDAAALAEQEALIEVYKRALGM